MGLEEILLFLALYGKPRLSWLTNGWYCCLDVMVTGKGVEFKIASEFDHPTPLEAVMVCKQRLEEAMRSLSSPGPHRPAQTLGDKS